MQARAMLHTAPKRVTVATRSLPGPDAHQVLIRTRHSAMSPGTESLIFSGRFPKDTARDSTIASLAGGFDYPFTYGYALVGDVMDIGPAVDEGWLGRRVFAFHPHQDHAVVALRDVIPVPETIDSRAALFLPNMESAVNFVMDAGPGLGDRVGVFGQGVVGLLTTALLARFPLSLLIAADPIATRRERALALGAHRAVDPENEEQWAALRQELFEAETGAGLDLAVEVSGNLRALNRAMDFTGFDGRIIVGSWYGRQREPLDLGGHFHRRRLQLISSQVSSLNPRLAGRWSKPRRIAQAWHAIAELAPERLITHTFPLHDCQRAFDLASSRDDGVLQVVFDYG